MKKLPHIIAALLLPIAVHAEDLAEIYQLALKNDPLLSSQQSAFTVANEARQQADALYRPNISFNASTSRSRDKTTASSSSLTQTGTDTYSTNAYSLVLRQPLYRKDYMSRGNQAEAAEQQADAELKQANQELVLRVGEAYFNVLAAEDNVTFAEAEKNAISRQLDQSKQRFDVGLIAITDVHEARAAYDQANASEIAARNTLATTRQIVRELTGELPQQLTPLGSQMQLVSPDPADINAWINNALANNQRLIAAKSSVEAASQNLEGQRANRHPAVDLVASHAYNDIGGGSFGGRETESDSISVELTVPLYQGGGISAGIRGANAQLNQARDGLEQQRRAVQRETSDAYLGVLTGISRVQALQQAVTSAESALKATEAGYDVGTRTSVDVLNARRTLFGTQRDLSRARYDYILARLRLQQTSGTLDAEAVAQVNGWLAAK
jgi:outer membrane protein